MRLLLDTHAWLWLLGGDARLPSKLRTELQGGEHTVFLSVVSCWEVAIKVGLGKLQLPVPVDTLLQEVSSAFEILNVRVEHVQRLTTLPRHHGDPFDRMLVAQAIAEDLTIVTADAAFHQYAAGIFWSG
jgi:PIN domain nuclease of toxin-antitoxin system